MTATKATTTIRATTAMYDSRNNFGGHNGHDGYNNYNGYNSNNSHNSHER